jgi:hypothetical protein
MENIDLRYTTTAVTLIDRKGRTFHQIVVGGYILNQLIVTKHFVRTTPKHECWTIEYGIVGDVMTTTIS